MKSQDLLTSWKPTLTAEEEKLLVPSGQKELLEMGKRFSKRLPDVFDTAGNDEDGDENSVFVVRHTLKQRTERSAAAFVEGAFGKQVIENSIQQAWSDQFAHIL